MIEIKDLEYEYRTYDDDGNVSGSLKALDGITLSVPKGQFLAVLGHNGCGKSTLAKHLNGILVGTAGRVTINGIDTADDERIFDVRQTVGMVFQNPDNQLVATVVEEDVAFALENLGVPPEEIRRRVDEALKTVSMYDYRAHSPHQLSGGQKQRVAIAGVLAMRPDCIVLDEPTAMLDPKGRREVMNTVRLLHSQGVTIVLITHYMEEAAQAERVVVMDHGKILMDDEPRRIFSRVEELRARSLDVPQVTELMHRLHKKGISVSKEVLNEEEALRELEKLPLKKGKGPAPTVKPISKAEAEPIAEVRDLVYKYSVGTPFEATAVDHVSLTVAKGEFIGVIGHTGSGKSTLIQHLNGLLKPTEGEIYIDRENIWGKNADIRAVRFVAGLVFQYSEYQLFEETVYKDIAYGPKNMGLSEEEIDRRVRAAAKSMGLSDELLNRSPFDLSGGQKRRAALAGVIAMQPRLLILDEPAAGLDPKGRDRVLSEIYSYHKESGTTILLVSHSMEDIVRYADKVLVMNRGRLFCFEETDAVFRRAREIRQVGLDLPQITKLSHLLAERDILLGDDVYTVEHAEERLLALLE
ncbi:MAG: energy-coupling factor transporter ATPase [Bacteroides sp.]|nr:energy-coupling factor transporter ATPase [Eubacterium sp.]MCM1418067.1 energy-coupling factor transporter ATPase [Roseburia sp.]MCM1462211.1 energy-coupling factor transporter ATPase [Bacteroides sp.]